MFSGPIELAANTKIFARVDAAAARQLLAYEMRVVTKVPLAMVLPLPTPSSSSSSSSASAEAVRFIDLSKSRDLFVHIDTALAASSDGNKSRGGPEEKKLAVERVGSFDASWVPDLSSFSRLDERFRIAADVWRALPQYADWSFAVFQLAAGESHTHPMGLSFATRAPKKLFFPTVHVHDGTVPSHADFDHALYAQGQVDVDGWARTHQRADRVLGALLAVDEGLRTLIHPPAYLRRCEKRGLFVNDDTWVPLWQTGSDA